MNLVSTHVLTLHNPLHWLLITHLNSLYLLLAEKDWISGYEYNEKEEARGRGIQLHPGKLHLNELNNTHTYTHCMSPRKLIHQAELCWSSRCHCTQTLFQMHTQSSQWRGKADGSNKSLSPHLSSCMIEGASQKKLQCTAQQPRRRKQKRPSCSWARYEFLGADSGHMFDTPL